MIETLKRRVFLSTTTNSKKRHNNNNNNNNRHNNRYNNYPPQSHLHANSSTTNITHLYPYPYPHPLPYLTAFFLSPCPTYAKSANNIFGVGVGASASAHRVHNKSLYLYLGIPSIPQIIPTNNQQLNKRKHMHA